MSQNKMTRSEALSKIKMMLDSLNESEKDMIRCLYSRVTKNPNDDDLLKLIEGLDVSKLRTLHFQISNTIRQKMREL